MFACKQKHLLYVFDSCHLKLLSPGVYSKIFAQREWIVDIICNDSTNLPSYCGGFTSRPTPAATPSPTASPTKSASPTAQCFNVPYWFDAFGDDCAWYGARADRCDSFGDSFAGTNGLTANEACCECGGGTVTPPPKCDDTPGWVDEYGDGCDWYEEIGSRCDQHGDSYPGPSGEVANQACCVCGGGTTTEESCDDDSTFTFVLNNGNTQDCAWFTANPDKAFARISRYCGRSDVSSACRETCDTCVNSCRDDPTFTFVLDNGNTQDCAWFTARPDKASLRISRYCGRSDVSSACRETCGVCEGSCRDDPTFTFVLNNGNTQGCAWFTAKPDKIDIRTNRYCGRSDVSSACKETCGVCV